jgi:hypothetical protein
MTRIKRAEIGDLKMDGTSDIPHWFRRALPGDQGGRKICCHRDPWIRRNAVS